MLFRASYLVVAALLVQSAVSTNCPAGQYKKSNGNCAVCKPGLYNPTIGANVCQECPAGQGPSSDRKSCTTCPAGKYSGSGTGGCQKCAGGTQNLADHTGCVACPDGQVSSPGGVCYTCPAGKGPNSAKTSCNTCTGETFSTGGTNCGKCPAGSEANSSKTGCDKCTPGSYNGTPGGSCKKCPAGQFNNIVGAKECCECCAGFHSTEDRLSCQKCPSNKPFSQVGSDCTEDCKEFRGSRPNPASTCNMVADNVCPNTTGDGPQGTAITRKRQLKCANGFTSCPRYSGIGGSDCVDTENDPESCGGCVGLDGQGSGTDCTAIKGTSATRCVKGSCVIDSCRKGWVKSLDGASCVSAHSSEAGSLHSQEKTKRSSAKRAVRHTMF